MRVAGKQAWGTAMHQDTTDGVRWLISKKLVDPGAFASPVQATGAMPAMLAVAKDTDMFRCAAR